MLFHQSAAQAMKKRVIVAHFTTKIIPVIRKFCLLKNIFTYCGYSMTSQFFLLLSEHKHCGNMANNSTSENAINRMVASLRGSVGTRKKEDESSTGRIWAAGFHHVMARSHLARVLKLMNRLFL
jgi:hypothetical protein